jgi:hypothetical protein
MISLALKAFHVNLCLKCGDNLFLLRFRTGLLSECKKVLAID